ncbi:IS256 family transposase [Streptosporangium sp. NPDC087985]|uniref:IS256 family transposase n=1 Tax=Streptosporangium sp. NPDC087985 TaxID=3366196 RepID=UPI00381A7C49
MSKTYQNKRRPARHVAENMAVPQTVSVAMDQIATSMRDGLLALAVQSGLAVMFAILDEDVTVICGPRGRHNPGRTAVRHGSDAGSVVLGGRRLPIRRPRVRTADGTGEVAIPSYELFSSTEILDETALGKMLGKLSIRRYPLGLEPVGGRIEQAATGTSKSSISRRFVAATERALADMMSADLSGLQLAALMLDGVHFGEHTCIVALGIGIDGTKYPLALVEGSTENATLARELIVGLRERGLDVTGPILVVLDGSKALRRAVLDVFDHPVIQRCQLHKIRNVRDRLPLKLRAAAEKRMHEAYHADTLLAAEAGPTALATELDMKYPGAAASLREGMDETLTVLRLQVPPTLARTLRSTNPIESMISICRDHAVNVKNWKNGQMALRWCAAGMAEASKQFRRVNGFLHLPKLRVALERHVTPQNATSNCYNENVA